MIWSIIWYGIIDKIRLFLARKSLEVVKKRLWTVQKEYEKRDKQRGGGGGGEEDEVTHF